MTPQNKLYSGDNLVMLRRYVKDESVDLVYLDPLYSLLLYTHQYVKLEKSQNHRTGITMEIARETYE